MGRGLPLALFFCVLAGCARQPSIDLAGSAGPLPGILADLAAVFQLNTAVFSHQPNRQSAAKSTGH
ncbi:hypothetical protein ACO34A_29065 (plasmid) [Rhizobium sp. ACO-34A]|nr:hypothetical protein ACO34A_29065 [Rhizobium sp. ACO-34A]